MNIIATFRINETDSMQALVPDFENKENYFYEPVKELQMFDVVTVEYQTNKIKLVLKKDAVAEVFGVFRNDLKRLLQNQLVLPKSIQPGDLGYNWNIDTDEDNFDINYSSYGIFSKREVQAFVYNKDDKMYLEIAPSYPWHYIEPVEDEEVISFEEFMQKYKPLALYELTKETVQKWIHEADLILEKMIKVKK